MDVEDWLWLDDMGGEFGLVDELDDEDEDWFKFNATKLHKAKTSDVK